MSAASETPPGARPGTSEGSPPLTGDGAPAPAPAAEATDAPSAAVAAAAEAPPVELRLTTRLVLFFGVGALSVAFDQLTKVLATEHLRGVPTRSYWGDIFRFHWATNEGAFLSLGSTLPPGLRFTLLTLGVGALLLGLCVHALRTSALGPGQLSGYALIVSGGFSNWIDRARFDGAVVDFMNLGLGRLRTGIFNVADVFILVGIGFLLLATWRAERLAARGGPNLT